MKNIARVTRYELDDKKMCPFTRTIFAEIELDNGKRINIQWARELHEEQRKHFDKVWNLLNTHVENGKPIWVRVKHTNKFDFMTVL